MSRDRKFREDSRHTVDIAFGLLSPRQPPERAQRKDKRLRMMKTLESTAKQMAENRADSAVVAGLAPIWRRQFQRQEVAAATLADLKRVVSWNQVSYVAAHRWTTTIASSIADEPGSQSIYRYELFCSDS